MKKTMILAAPCLIMLAACGGGSTGNSSFENLQNAPVGSVVLSADTPVEAASIDEILAVNFTDSPVGSSIVITEGALAGVSFVKSEPIAGKETILLTQRDGIELTAFVSGSSEAELAAAIQLLEVEGSEVSNPSVQTLNGGTVNFWSETKALGAIESEFTEIYIGTGDRSVSGNVGGTTLNGETTISLGTKRSYGVGGTDSYQSRTVSGDFVYEGLATVFGEEASYTTNEAKMTVNFVTGDGNLIAENFNPDEDSTPLVVTVDSDIALNNATGFITSTGGLLKVGNEEGSIAVSGVLSEGNDAVAGVLIAENEVNGIIGGVFALPETPQN